MKNLIEAIYQHYNLQGYQMLYPGQAKPTEVSGIRAEIKVFGPFIQIVGREKNQYLQVRIDLTLPLIGNVYNWANAAQAFIDQANLPLLVSEDDCWSCDDTRVRYRGANESLEFCEIEISYNKETEL